MVLQGNHQRVQQRKTPSAGPVSLSLATAQRLCLLMAIPTFSPLRQATAACNRIIVPPVKQADGLHRPCLKGRHDARSKKARHALHEGSMSCSGGHSIREYGSHAPDRNVQKWVYGDFCVPKYAVHQSGPVVQSSLRDLNSRVPEPMDMNRFRPNIVIDDSMPAWDEDNWQTFTLGGEPGRAVNFHSLKPCSRCKVLLQTAPHAISLAVSICTGALMRCKDSCESKSAL